MVKYVYFHNYQCLLEDVRYVISEILGEYLEKINDEFDINVEARFDSTNVLFSDGKCTSTIAVRFSSEPLEETILDIEFELDDTLQEPVVALHSKFIVVYKHTHLDNVSVDLSCLYNSNANTKFLRYLKSIISTTMDNLITHIALERRRKR